MSRIRRDCFVWGALALTLQVSRLVGVAPLRMIRENGKWRVSASFRLCVYSFLAMIVLHAGVFTGLAIDLSVDNDDSVRVRTLMSRITWIGELIVIISIATVGVLESPARMREMIELLNIIEKIHKLSNKDWKNLPFEKKKYIAAVIILVTVNFQYLADMYTFTSDAIIEVGLICIICFNIECLITVLLEMQFLFLALHVNSALGFVNDSLNDLVCFQSLPFTFVPRELRAYTITPSVKSVNFMIDNIKAINDTITYDANYIKQTQENVRNLVPSFGVICDVIRQINTSYGKVLLLLLISFFLHLVLTPYYLIVHIHSPKAGKVNLILQSMHVVLHAGYLVIAVEPGHRTEQEIGRTSMLVSQLLRRISSPHDCLAQELDLFYKQILLNKVSYAPLGICILARPLIAAICGGVTTYLVIILQFQAIDKQNW